MQSSCWSLEVPVEVMSVRKDTTLWLVLVYGVADPIPGRGLAPVIILGERREGGRGEGGGREQLLGSEIYCYIH